MTGVEAVSNGVQSFKEPVVGSARLTLAMIVAILILILLGVAYLVSAYGITATEPGTPNYQSVLSLISAAVVGRGLFYFVTLAAILLVLCLSAKPHLRISLGFAVQLPRMVFFLIHLASAADAWFTPRVFGF